MALYAIGDLHLCLGAPKPMDVFGGAWTGYMDKLRQGCSVIGPEDTTVLLGDLSWALSLEESAADFAWINAIPGRKIILKGNHDYWWSTKKKADKFFEENGITTIKILNNNAYKVGDFALCGSRGWFFDSDKQADQKIVAREAGRLRMSIEAADKLGGEKIAFLHYPPIAGGQVCQEICDELVNGGVSQCYYGHLHGYSTAFAFNDEMFGIKFHLVSGDYLNFCPKLIVKF